MKPIFVVSAGPGRADMLTFEAKTALDSSSAVFCAARHQVLADGEKIRPLFPFEQAFSEIDELRAENKQVSVLVSGDAGIYSLLPRLTERFGKENVKVFAGISALQAFSAAVKTPWQDSAVISAHGRELSPSALCHYVRTNKRVFMFLDREHNARWIRESLARGGLENVTVTCGSRLSYPDEYVGMPSDEVKSDLCMALIENSAPNEGFPPVGIADDDFIRAKTPMTKREIRMQVINELRLNPSAIVWDVGAGTGSVSIEAARQCPFGRVYAIEHKEDALELIKQNTEKFHILNCEIIAGHAPEAFSELPVPTHVFLGGTGHETNEILDIIDGFGSPVRVVATAVTMETAHILHERLMKYADFAASQTAVSRLTKVGGYTMLQAQNPVYVYSATLGGFE